MDHEPLLQARRGPVRVHAGAARDSIGSPQELRSIPGRRCLLGGLHTSYPGLGIVDGDTGSENPVPHYHWNTAYWANPEVGIDIRLGQHFSLRPFLGAAVLLNPNDGVPVVGQYGEQPSKVGWVPYVGVAIGYALMPGW
jgi:hypothetical protein